MSESPNRTRLREAIAAVEAAQVAVTQAERTAERAKADMESAKVDLAATTGAQRDVLEWKLERLKNGSETEMPPKLAEGLRKQTAAAEHFTDAEAIVEMADADLKVARHGLKAAEAEKRAALHAVVMEGAQGVIAALDEVNQRRHHLRLLVQGVSLPDLGGDWSTMVSVIHSGLQDVAIELRENMGPIRKVQEFWLGWADALLTDPDAAMPTPPTWDALFS